MAGIINKLFEEVGDLWRQEGLDTMKVKMTATP